LFYKIPQVKNVCLVVVMIFYQSPIVWSQQQSIDSLENLIQLLPDDTSKVNKWNKLAGEIQFENPGKAAAIIKSTITLSEQIDYDFGLSVAYGLRAVMFFYEMKLDSSKLLLDKAYSLVSKNNDIKSRQHKAFIIHRYAGIYQQKQKYDSAIRSYLQAASLFTELNDKTKVIYCYYNLSGIFNSLEDTTKCIFYARETRRIALEVKDSVYIMRSFMALADAFVSLKKYDSLLLISQKGLDMANRDGFPFPIGKFHLLLGTYYINKAMYDKAIFHFNSALQAFNKINLGYEIALALQNMGHAYLQKKDYADASNYLKKAATHSRELKLDQVLRLSLVDLVTSEEKLGHVSESLQYLKEYVAVNDSVLHRNNRKTVYDLETKYQTQKKEVLLQAQQKMLKQKSLLNYLLTGVVLSVLVISFFLYQTYQQKRRLQQQRINELEKEKQLSASEAVLKGQDEERTRLAKDLHDGLGGLLSGVKFSLSNMKSNVVMDAESVLVFERSLDMLDHSISELRRVAHNMMPEVLVRYGLTEALKSYCDSLRESTVFKIDFQSIGMEVRLASNTEIFIYRIIQELLNNAAKHAKAGQVLVQLARQGGEVSVTVEDDGIGFDKTVIDQSEGAGWANIRSRVDYLKGKVDIRSAPGEGTSVHITIPVS
jgi:two-component system, NarL family, sensor kinase